ncbi:MAG: ATP synthase F0 subunit B [Bacteriovoracaceae bacterium]|nr:ATP synthase F0 subunit B [Bacteriovoracaceae bacterium]
MVWNAYLILGLSAIATDALASGGGHKGHLTDLIAPLVNVAVLAGFLIWKLKKPMSEHFKKMSEEIENTLERASLKSKEAEVMLQAQKKKMANVEAEAKEIIRHAESEIKTYEKAYAREIEEKSFKLKTDATSKIEAERKAMIGALNATLLDEVIAKAKTTIKGNKDFQNQASAKIFGDMIK